MSVGEESLTTFYTGPLVTLGNPEPSFNNMPLNNNVGKYTVYKIFDSLIDPLNNYKMYAVRIDINVINAGQQSLNNPLPAPYCALSRMAFPSVLFFNPPNSALTITLASNGQTFDIQNNGTGTIFGEKGGFYIIGY